MLLRQSLLYLIANAIAALLGFVSVMVLTRLVAPAEYGVFVVVMSAGAVLSTVFFTWQRHAILRYQSEAAADVRLSLLCGYLLTLAMHPLALLVLIYLLRMPWNKALAAVLIAAAGAFFELGQEILRARQQVPAYVRGVIVRSCVTLCLCLLSVWLDLGGFGLVMAVLASFWLSAALSARQVWGAPRVPASRATLRELAAYGLPITLSGAFVALTLALDRFVVYAWLGTEAVGIYGATADFVRQCAMLPAMSASIALAPIAIANLNADQDETTRRCLADGAELLLAVALPVAAGLSIAAPQVAGTILGASYRGLAEQLIPLLAFAFMAHAISQQYVQLSFGLAKKPAIYIVHTASIFAVNLALIVPLVLRFGAVGAAASFLISEVVGVMAGLWLARKAYPLPAITDRLARILVASGLMALVCLMAQLVIDRTDAIGLAGVVVTGVVTYAIASVCLNVAQVRPLVLARLAGSRAQIEQTGP